MLMKFAEKSVDSLECLELNIKGLRPHTMQSLVNMTKILFENEAADIEDLNLWNFSNNELEGV